MNAKSKAVEKKKGERSIDFANRTSKKPESMFKGRDYLGTRKGSNAYKEDYVGRNKKFIEELKKDKSPRKKQVGSYF